MTESKAMTMIGFSVIVVTKKIMNTFSLSAEDAFRKLLETDFYPILRNMDSRLYLETNEYLCEACLLEMTEGKEAMYEYINNN